MKEQQRVRLFILFTSILFLVIASSLIFKVFADNILYYYTPSDLIEKNIAPSKKTIRVGGLVTEIIKQDNVGQILFSIADQGTNTLEVQYKGVLPALFRKGQGAIASGHLESKNLFIAHEILAKHDENYKPPYTISQKNKP